MGIGPDDPRRNPLAAAHLPQLSALLGGTLPIAERMAKADAHAGEARLAAIDACLGVPGLPQSGTGQTSLLAGINAPALLERHFGPWVHTQLREVLAEENLLSRARRAGRSAAFANAYPRAYISDTTGRALRRPAAPPFAARAAGVLTRDEADLRARRAVASEIDNVLWRERLDPGLHPIRPAEAGAVLAKVAAGAEVTLYAHYATDTAGHTGDMAAAVRSLERVDALLGGLAAHRPPELLVVMTSDHGNVEDIKAEHTRNPVPLIAFGPGSERLIGGITSIDQVTPAILRLLGIP